MTDNVYDEGYTPNDMPEGAMTLTDSAYSLAINAIKQQTENIDKKIALHISNIELLKLYTPMPSNPVVIERNKNTIQNLQWQIIKLEKARTAVRVVAAAFSLGE